MPHLLCIGGPHVGKYLEVSNGVDMVRWTSLPRFKPPVSLDETAIVKVKIHTYRVEQLGGREYLVHNSIGSNWIEYVIERYAKRYKRA